MELRDRVVVVTGAASGLGAACASRFVDAGARVVITDRNAEGLGRVAATTGAAALAGDVTDEAHVGAVADLARSTYGDVDVWFSNAGIAGPPTAAELPDDAAWDASWKLHVMAHVYAARAVLPAMLARGSGALVSTASSVALSVHPDKASYSVTKHAALALAEWLAVAYGPRGIQVSCYCPAVMLTPMFRAHDYPDDHPAVVRALTPDQAAAQVQAGIEAGRFLIADGPAGIDQLRAKAEDYDAWVRTMGAPRG